MNQTSKTATAKAAKTTKTPAAKPAKIPAGFPLKTQDEGLHKLRVGDVIQGEKGKEMVVYFLNESRACIAPLDSNIKHRLDDNGVIRFAAGKDSENISPDSLTEVLRSLGRTGLAEYLDNRDKQTEAESMKAKDTPKKAKAKAAKKQGTGTPGIRAGSLGTYEGFSVASVVRTLGRDGWNAKEVRAFLDKQNIEASDQTVKLNIYRGVNKCDGECAPLTKDQYPTKPVIKEDAKPSKKAAAKAPAKKTAPAPAKKVATAKAAPAAKPTAKPAAAGKTPAEQVAALKAAKAAQAKA